MIITEKQTNEREKLNHLFTTPVITKLKEQRVNLSEMNAVEDESGGKIVKV